MAINKYVQCVCGIITIFLFIHSVLKKKNREVAFGFLVCNLLVWKLERYFYNERFDTEYLTNEIASKIREVPNDIAVDMDLNHKDDLSVGFEKFTQSVDVSPNKKFFLFRRFSEPKLAIGSGVSLFAVYNEKRQLIHYFVLPETAFSSNVNWVSDSYLEIEYFHKDGYIDPCPSVRYLSDSLFVKCKWE